MKEETAKPNIGNGSSLKIKAILVEKGQKEPKNRGRVCGKTYENCGKGCVKTRKSVQKTSMAMERSNQAESLADFLIGKLEAENCRKYFIKCAYHLSMDEIAEALQEAYRPNVISRVKYFNAITKKMLAKRGF